MALTVNVRDKRIIDTDQPGAQKFECWIDVVDDGAPEDVLHSAVFRVDLHRSNVTTERVQGWLDQAKDRALKSVENRSAIDLDALT